MSDRYLTPREKLRVLSDWAQTLATTPRTTPETSGRGFVDSEMILWCEHFNALREVVTLQSCSGHDERDGHGASDGVLWLWCESEVAQRVYKMMPSVAAIQGVTLCTVLWMPDGQEIVSINFDRHQRVSVLGRLWSSMRLVTTT